MERLRNFSPQILTSNPSHPSRYLLPRRFQPSDRTWHEIEDRITNKMGYQPAGVGIRTQLNEYVASVSLNIRRVNCVRTTFIHAEWQAAELLRQRFSDLDISSILHELIGVVTQMAMIVAGSVLIGGVIGAGVGVLAGGAGAIPMGMGRRTGR